MILGQSHLTMNSLKLKTSKVVLSYDQLINLGKFRDSVDKTVPLPIFVNQYFQAKLHIKADPYNPLPIPTYLGILRGTMQQIHWILLHC